MLLMILCTIYNKNMDVFGSHALQQSFSVCGCLTQPTTSRTQTPLAMGIIFHRENNI